MPLRTPLRIVLIFIMLLYCSISCKRKSKADIEPIIEEASSSVKHAKGFDLFHYKGFKKLVIKSPYPEAKDHQEFILIDKGQNTSGKGPNISVPLKKIVATSTTHIPMLEILNEENSIIGFPNTDYISSKKTTQRIKQGKILDLGNEQDFNTEVLISLQPDAIIAFSMGNTTKLYGAVEKNNIPVIYNGDWLEETPLGRAEWIKFFGALFDKNKEADSIFNAIELEYNAAKEVAVSAKITPTIMSGVLYKDKWNLPAGESFTAQLYRDANTDYLWKDSKGQGSLVLSFETVFELAEKAEFWIGSGYYTNLEELQNANAHYKQFKAFERASIYSFSKRRGENGGVEYFELGPLQPHIVLKDLIKVCHPELLPNYQPYFLQPLD